MKRTVLMGFFLAVAAAGVAASPAPAARTDDEAAARTVKAMKVGPAETIIFVEDMHCSSCAKKVSSRLFKLKGVLRVRTSVKLDAAVITPQSKKRVDAAAAWAALQAGGYQPTRLMGPEGVFLPDGEKQEPLKVAESAEPWRS